MSTFENLSLIYRHINRLPPGADLPAQAMAQISVMAQGVDAARLGASGDLWSYAGAIRWIEDDARATTGAAALVYGFLADTGLGTAGLNYLVSASGGNPNNLNSAYYAKFNLENRYINLSVTLAKEGQARSAFIATYGESAAMADTFQIAYTKLFGVAKPVDDILRILAEPIPDGRGGSYSRADYFADLGADGPTGLGARAALVGWLMAEAAKSGLGPYADALRSYLADVAADGEVNVTDRFIAVYGPGGDLALGGPADPGRLGETAQFAPDWNVDYTRRSGQDAHILASEGNDVLSAVASGDGGLDAGRVIMTGAGNDLVATGAGTVFGRIDTGAGNDRIVMTRLDGVIDTGTGYDLVEISGFAALHQVGGKIVDIALIDAFAKGFDHLKVMNSGPGEKRQLVFVATATFEEVLAVYSQHTAANANTVFEWGGDTYVYHQNLSPGLDAGDGLVRLAGAVGLTVGMGGGPSDILFLV